MPIWKSDLTDEQKWKAVMAAYDLAGVEPRKPEKLESAAPPPARRVASLPEILARPAWAQPAPPPAADPIARGREIYLKRCSLCHGEKGDGQGPVAPFLTPRPRDFVMAAYKFRTTASGEPPTDEDLFRVVTRGVPGTAMPGWGLLPEQDRRDVIAYIKQFSDAFKEKGTVVKPSKEIPGSPEVVARGREVYRRAKCWECHGEAGRGDGPAARKLKDDAGAFIQAADLTKGWRIKGGREARDIFVRFSTGLDGTPMPSFADSLKEDERWALAHYVSALQTDEEPGSPVVLRAVRIAGDLPSDPDDPRWRGVPYLAVPLAGQVLARPRWQNHSVDAVTLRAFYNDRGIAFLLEWDDPFRSVQHAPGPGLDLRGWTYPTIDLTKPRTEKLRDAVRLQFPVALPAGIERPHFFLGSPGHPVSLWHWQSDLGESGRNPVVKELAQGFQSPIQAQPEGAQDVVGRSLWKDGRWKVTMVRPLAPRAGRDITFEPGRLIPFAVHAWDGDNGEKGLMMSLSSWNYVTLEAPIPVAVYLYSLLGVMAVAIAEWGLVRRVRRRESGGGRDPGQIA
jgi:DMSO reductase family type II enzyme heme b subunit